jgi:hypothetical protein
VREVLYGGAGGGGKTWGLIAYPLRQIQVEHERWKKRETRQSLGWAIIFRRVMPNLSQTIDRARILYEAVDPHVRFDVQKSTFTFSCGYKVQFAGMEGLKDYFKYKGPEYSFIGFDEVTEFAEEQYIYMGTRLRSPDPVLSKMLWIRAATNPEGEGLLWVRKRFVEPASPETVIRTRIRKRDGSIAYRDRMFIPAKLSDNPHLDASDYEMELLDKPQHIRKAILDGDWYVTAGAYFEHEWDARIHVVRPFAIPGNWTRFRAGDYGYNKPSCILWFAVDYDANLVVYRELYVKRHTSEMLAHRIRELEQDADEWDPERGSRLSGYLDPSCWSRTGHTGPSIAEEMISLGVRWAPADNDRIAGWQQVRKRLIARGGKDFTVPGVRIFENCHNLKRTLPSLQPDDSKPEDMATTGEDHAADALRYGCMSRQIASVTLAQREEEEIEDELAAMRSRRASSMRLVCRFMAAPPGFSPRSAAQPCAARPRRSALRR